MKAAYTCNSCDWRAEERHRMTELYRAGALPFAQLYLDPENKLTYSKEWRAFHKEWCRPCATNTIMKQAGIL